MSFRFTEIIEKEYLDRSMSFAEYDALVDTLVAENRTTGPNQLQALVDFTRLNQVRMRRLMKTVSPEGASADKLRSISGRQVWLVITEGWCGDGAQNVPAIEVLAGESPNVETRYILRDENPELIDRFLTGGSRSIPKVIVLDRETRVVLGSWGPRPAAAQELFDRLKSEGVDKPIILEELQRWYNADKGRSVQTEMADVACKCEELAEQKLAVFA